MRGASLKESMDLGLTGLAEYDVLDSYILAEEAQHNSSCSAPALEGIQAEARSSSEANTQTGF